MRERLLLALHFVRGLVLMVCVCRDYVEKVRWRWGGEERREEGEEEGGVEREKSAVCGL